MSNKTAVDFAFEKLANQGLLITKDYKNLVAYREALQMERERIIHANMQGRLHNSNGESWKVEDAQYEANEWYVKTYGGQDE